MSVQFGTTACADEESSQNQHICPAAVFAECLCAGLLAAATGAVAAPAEAVAPRKPFGETLMTQVTTNLDGVSAGKPQQQARMICVLLDGACAAASTYPAQAGPGDSHDPGLHHWQQQGCNCDRGMI